MAGQGGHEQGEAMTVMDAAVRLAEAITEDAGHRAQERLREAEDEAATRVAAARADAQRMLRARREGVATASDELMRRAQATLDLLTAAEQARDELGRAVRELAESATPPPGPWPPDTAPSGTEPTADAERPPRAEPPPDVGPRSAEPPPDTEPSGPEAPAGGEDPLSSARLVALQLAVGGSSRTDAVRHLERELGLEDPAPIVDDVFAAYAARRSGAADGRGQ